MPDAEQMRRFQMFSATFEVLPSCHIAMAPVGKTLEDQCALALVAMATKGE